MNKIQERQLKMALEVDRICKKYKLNYSLDSGSLLGAIRHKGFIPWDDDLDIIMPRKDYDKFLEVAQEELGDKYFVQNVFTEKNFGFIFTKIRENNTIYLEEMAKNVDINHGIFIDIFPIETTDSDEKKARKIYKKIIILRMLLLCKTKYILKSNTLIKKIELIILKIASIFIPKKWIIKKATKLQTLYNGQKTDLIALYTSYNFHISIYDVNKFNKFTTTKFEGYDLSIITGYDYYLSLMYGDYMTPPPEKKRDNMHGIIKIELNEKD